MQAQVETLVHVTGAHSFEGSSLKSPEPTHDKLISASELYSKEHLIVPGIHDTPQNIDTTSMENKYPSGRVDQSRAEGAPGTPETAKAEVQKEVMEQFEPGVYVTVLLLPNGSKLFRRIRFRFVVNISCSDFII